MCKPDHPAVELTVISSCPRFVSFNQAMAGGKTWTLGCSISSGRVTFSTCPSIVHDINNDITVEANSLTESFVATSQRYPMADATFVMTRSARAQHANPKPVFSFL